MLPNSVKCYQPRLVQFIVNCTQRITLKIYSSDQLKRIDYFKLPETVDGGGSMSRSDKLFQLQKDLFH